MTPFLITGSGRTGTKYIATLLSGLGIATGWEVTCNPFHPAHRARDFLYILRRHRLCGDANWLAVPYLVRIPQEVRLFHQTRHPLKVIRSLLTLRFFGDDYVGHPWKGDLRHTSLVTGNLPVPVESRQATSVECCMRYWVSWNQLCEDFATKRGFTYSRYRFEDVLNPETGVLAGICREVGRPTLPALWPEIKNTHQQFAAGEGREFKWADLPDGHLKEKVRQMAYRYGYSAVDVPPGGIVYSPCEVCS